MRADQGVVPRVVVLMDAVNVWDQGPAAGMLALLILSGGGCEPGDGYELGDTAALATTWRSGAEDPAATAPAGYLFAVNGTHVEPCTGLKCPTMWAESPSPNNCGRGFEPAESYIVHQRGVDWDGLDGEEELHGNEYLLAERITPYPSPGEEPPGALPTQHNQSVIIQCCPAEPARPNRPGAFIDMKVCPDPCDAPDGLCPITLADRTDVAPFGTCRTTLDFWLIDTDRCDLVVVEAGWNDPHAPHDLTDPSGDDKRVFNVYHRAAWP